jgi:hypothetical protein
MALKFPCTTCGNDLIVLYLKPGEAAKCRACGNTVIVPAGATATEDIPLYKQGETVVTKEVKPPLSPEKRLERAAVASLVLGIVAVVTPFVPFIGLLLWPVFSVLAIIYGVRGLKSKRLAISIIGLVLGILQLIVLFIALAVIAGMLIIDPKRIVGT